MKKNAFIKRRYIIDNDGKYHRLEEGHKGCLRTLCGKDMNNGDFKFSCIQSLSDLCSECNSRQQQ